MYYLKQGLFSLACVGIGVALGMAYVRFGETPARIKVIGQTNGQKKVSIAVLIPVMHPSLEQIKDGFVKTMQKKGATIDPVFTHYYGNGDRRLMFSQAEEALGGEHDLVFAIATPCALMSKEVALKRNLHVPIVAAAVSDINLVYENGKMPSFMTGVTDVESPQEQLAMYTYLKPSAKRIALVYDASSAKVGRDIPLVVRAIHDHGLEVQEVPVYATNEMVHKLLPHITAVDTCLVLKDNTVVAGLEGIVTLCSRHGVTLLASDLDSPARGAAIGFGVRERETGVVAAQQALQILEKGVSPAHIPVQTLTDYHVVLQPEVFERQGLQLDERLLFLISRGSVVSQQTKGD